VTRSYRPASPGTGSGKTRCATRWARLLVALLVAPVVHGGCSTDFKDGLGPRKAIPNVSGRVERDGVAASTVDVTVRDPDDDSTIADAETDANGYYVLAAPVGVWEVKVKGRMPTDFASVARGFVVSSASQQITIDSLDIFAYEATLVAPADGATIGRPTESYPVTFRWSPPRHAIVSARTQLYDGSGQAVWFSAKSSDSSAVWDGTGNQGPFAGLAVSAGGFTWRVKFDLPDSSEARTASRSVTFQ